MSRAAAEQADLLPDTPASTPRRSPVMRGDGSTALARPLGTDSPESEGDQAAVSASHDWTAMVERLASNPSVDVEKLERIIALQERVLRFNAKAAFDAAFSKMQPEIPTLDERGRIEVRGQLRSTYTPLEDIHDVVKPICAKHGFAIRHRTEWPTDKAGIIRIVGILSHEQGHSEESTFEAPMDKSEYRTDIQSQGSTVSYGRRYTTLDLLNIATRGQDKDGQQQKARADIKAPDGYEAWFAVIGGLVADGLPALTEAWNTSKPDFRNHLIATNKDEWARMKAEAAKVKK